MEYIGNTFGIKNRSYGISMEDRGYVGRNKTD